MSEKNTTRRAKPDSFLVGGKVYVPFGKKKRLARIVEDRGAIGRGGRRLLRVTFAGGDHAVEQSFEIPAADVTHVKPSIGAIRMVKARAVHA